MTFCTLSGHDPAPPESVVGWLGWRCAHLSRPPTLGHLVEPEPGDSFGARVRLVRGPWRDRDRIDPVGSCVGIKGARIHGIVRELRNENIDVLNYTPRLDIMVQRALAPAKVSSLKVDEEAKKVEVFMEPDQVSLAIGKGGCNIKLASKLVGYDIDVYRKGDEYPDDVDLREFSDEIDQWIIDVLINIGCDTARNVLAMSKEDLLSRTDLEEETIDEVIRILKAEFEDDNVEESEGDKEDNNDSEPAQPEENNE